MSNIELRQANEQLFATTEELTTISSQLVVMRIDEERLENPGDCKTTPSERSSEATNARSSLDLDAETACSELSSLSARFAFYSGTGDLIGKKWSVLNQVEADIEDETCQLFGLVGGFLLDTVKADRIRLNTEEISDGLIKIITLTLELNGATVDRQIEATGEHYDSRTLEMGLGGVRRATRFISAVNDRFEAVVSDMANTASK